MTVVLSKDHIEQQKKREVEDRALLEKAQKMGVDTSHLHSPSMGTLNRAELQKRINFHKMANRPRFTWWQILFMALGAAGGAAGVISLIIILL